MPRPAISGGARLLIAPAQVHGTTGTTLIKRAAGQADDQWRMLSPTPPMSNNERQRLFRERNPGYFRRYKRSHKQAMAAARAAMAAAAAAATTATPATAAAPMPSAPLALPAPREPLMLPAPAVVPVILGMNTIAAIPVSATAPTPRGNSAAA